MRRKREETNWKRALLQSALASACIVGIMLTLDLLLQTAIVTTLGATTFIVFAMPHARPAQPRRLLGGYALGAVAGTACWLVARYAPGTLPLVPAHTEQIVLAGIAVGISTLLMVGFHMEHPPAAGFALGLVLDDWTWATLIFVAAAITILCTMRLLLNRVLDDLV